MNLPALLLVGLLPLLQAPRAEAAPDVAADVAVEQARDLLRRGLLRETEAALAALPGDASAEVRARAEILLGNVAYERGRFGEASSLYELAVRFFESTAASGAAGLDEALATARGNRRMAQDRIDRQAVLASAVAGLRAALWATLGAAALLVVLLVRRSGQPPATG